MFVIDQDSSCEYDDPPFLCGWDMVEKDSVSIKGILTQSY